MLNARINKQQQTTTLQNGKEDGKQCCMVSTQVYSLNCKWDGLAPIINKAGSYVYQEKLRDGK